MSFTVNDPGPEREPEPTYDTSVVHYDLDNVDLLTGCGLELNDLTGHDTYSTDPAAVDCPQCAATLGGVQLADPITPEVYAEHFPERDDAGEPLPDTDIRGALAADLERMGLMPGPVEESARPEWCEVHQALLDSCPGDPKMPCAPRFYNDEIGERPGYVAGDCGHAMALSEWRAGFRVCERCPKPYEPEPVDGAAALAAAWDGPDLTDVQQSYEQDYRDHLARQAEAVEAAPERRTVGLEVLTDELRAEYAKASDDPVWGGSVAVVCRVNGKAIDIPELDTLWAAPYRKPADILSILLRQARMYADGLDGQAGAELLMPGADVLGALAGNLWAGFTAAVESRWGIVQPGWWVSVETLDRDADPDVEWALVDDRDECHDPVCVVRAGGASWACAVTTVQGRGVQHLDAFRAVYVRIPADSAVQA